MTALAQADRRLFTIHSATSWHLGILRPPPPLLRRRLGHAELPVGRSVEREFRLSNANRGAAVAHVPPPWRNLEILE